MSLFRFFFPGVIFFAACTTALPVDDAGDETTHVDPVVSLFHEAQVNVEESTSTFTSMKPKPVRPGGTVVRFNGAGEWEKHRNQHFDPGCSYPSIGGFVKHHGQGAAYCAKMCEPHPDCTGFHVRGHQCQFCKDNLVGQKRKNQGGCDLYYKLVTFTAANEVRANGRVVVLGRAGDWELHHGQHFNPGCKSPSIGGFVKHHGKGAEWCADRCRQAADCTGFHVRGDQCQFCKDGLAGQTPRGQGGCDLYYKLEPRECGKPSDIEGNWKYAGYTNGQRDFSYSTGVSTSDSSSRTKSWEHSLSISVEKEFRTGTEFAGSSTKFSVTNTYTRGASETVSRSIEKSTQNGLLTKFDQAGQVWQFEFSSKDHCGSSTLKTDDLVITNGKFDPPCCLPGFALDKKQQHGQCAHGSPCTCSPAICNPTHAPTRNPSPAPTPNMGCPTVCRTENKDVFVRCESQLCKYCDFCQVGYTFPPKSRPSKPQLNPSKPKGVCENWCGRDRRPWSKKCTWAKFCGGCGSCSAAKPKPTPTPRKPTWGSRRPHAHRPPHRPHAHRRPHTHRPKPTPTPRKPTWGNRRPHAHRRPHTHRPKPSKPKGGCIDTAGWGNGYRGANGGKGFSCADYTAKGWCKDGARQQWTLGSKFKYPEQNCCACGKQAAKI